LTKLIIAKAHTWQNIHLQKQTLVKEKKEKLTNGEILNQTHYSYYEKRKTTHNVIFIWDKRNPKPILTPFCTLY
jgi:hypothetical protein